MEGTYLKQGANFFFKKQQNVKQSFDVHLTEDQKQKKMDLMSLDPSLLEWPAKPSSQHNSWEIE